MSGDSRATVELPDPPLGVVCVPLLLAKISDTFGICKALLGPFHCYTPLITWKHASVERHYALKSYTTQVKGFLPRRWDIVPFITVYLVERWFANP